MPSARTSRSDPGIMALTRAVFEDILGLAPETATRMIKIIRNQGQLQDLKLSLRGLSGVAYRRLNDVVDMAKDRQKGELSPIDDDSTNGGGEKDVELNLADSDKVETHESETFLRYLLTELQFDTDDLTDPQTKQEIARLVRAGPQQADRMIKRAEHQQKADRRQELQQADDPRRISLLRKQQNLQKQLQTVQQQLNDIETQAPHQNQPPNNTGAKL